MWWLNTTQDWKGISQKIYYAAGYGGNYIVVDKEHDLVVVTRWMDETKISEIISLIIQSTEIK